MIAPMLAVPMDKGIIEDWNDWALEQKYDGHRLIVQVGPGSVQAWTRPRRRAGVNGKAMAPRILPPHLIKDLAQLPPGVYDGELLGGETSTDVTRIDLQHKLSFVVFDVLQQLKPTTGRVEDATGLPYDARRFLLERTFGWDAGGNHKPIGSVILTPSMPARSQEHVATLVDIIWKQGGEGAILKRTSARYQPGKRSADFIKVKKLMTEVGKVVAFEPTRGKVLRRGIFASVVLEAPNGRTSVKTKDDAELARFLERWQRCKEGQQAARTLRAAQGGAALDDRQMLALVNEFHPDLGRMLRFEYQDWTPKGGYRHPRWDRWEDE